MDFTSAKSGKVKAGVKFGNGKLLIPSLIYMTTHNDFLLGFVCQPFPYAQFTISYP